MSLLQLFDDAALYRVLQIINSPRIKGTGPVHISETTFYKLIRDGKLPRGHHLSDNVVVWTGRELNEAFTRLIHSSDHDVAVPDLVEPVPQVPPSDVPLILKRARGRPRKHLPPDPLPSKRPRAKPRRHQPFIG